MNFKDFGFRQLNLPRPVYLVDDSVQVDVEENVITAKALFPSSDPTLADRKDGHVNVQHFEALGSNLFHTLVAAKSGGKMKNVRIISLEAHFHKEVKQDTEIEVSLSYIGAETGYVHDGRPVYAGAFFGGPREDLSFEYQYRIVMW